MIPSCLLSLQVCIVTMKDTYLIGFIFFHESVSVSWFMCCSFCFLFYLSSTDPFYLHVSQSWGEKIPWRIKCNPLQCSCLGNPMDREAWQTTVHGITKESDTTEHVHTFWEKCISNEMRFSSFHLICETEMARPLPKLFVTAPESPRNDRSGQSLTWNSHHWSRCLLAHGHP